MSKRIIIINGQNKSRNDHTKSIDIEYKILTRQDKKTCWFGQNQVFFSTDSMQRRKKNSQQGKNNDRITTTINDPKKSKVETTTKKNTDTQHDEEKTKESTKSKYIFSSNENVPIMY